MNIEEQVTLKKIAIEESTNQLALQHKKLDSIENLITQESKSYTQEILKNWDFYLDNAVELGLCTQDELEYYTNTYKDVSSDLPSEFYRPVMSHISFIMLRRLSYTLFLITLIFYFTSIHQAYKLTFLTLVLSFYISDALGLVGYGSKFHRKKPVTSLLQRFIIRRYTVRKLQEEGVDVSLL